MSNNFYKLLDQAKDGRVTNTDDMLFNAWVGETIRNNPIMKVYVDIFESIREEDDPQQTMENIVAWKQRAKQYLSQRQYSQDTMNLADDYIDAFNTKFSKLKKRKLK